MISEKQKTLVTFGERPGKTCLAVGTVRSGKTYSSAVGLILHTQKLKESYTHFILGRKLKVMENEIVPVFRKIGKALGLPTDHIYNITDQRIRMGGQTYFLIAGADERAAERLQGFTCHSMLIDEATIVPKSFLEMALSRMTFSAGRCWLTCNPSHPLHYLKTDWIDGGRVSEHHQFTFEDNPTLEESVKESLRAQFTGVFAKRMIEGLWYAGDGLVYPEFRRRKRPDEVDIVRTDIGVDYGPASTTAAVALQTLRDRTYHVPSVTGWLGGAEMINKTDRELCDGVTKFAKVWGAKSVCKDPSAASFHAELLRAPGRTFSVRNARNDIVPGIRKLGAALATGLVTLDESVEVEPLLNEMKSYCWDVKKPDVPHKEHDHYCDALRYVAVDTIRDVFENVPLPEGM